MKILRICHTDIRKSHGGLQQHLRLLNRATLNLSNETEIAMLFPDSTINHITNKTEKKVKYISIPIDRKKLGGLQEYLTHTQVHQGLDKALAPLITIIYPLIFVSEVVKTLYYSLKVIVDEKPHIVQNHYYYRTYGILVSLAAKVLRIPLIHSYHVGQDKYGLRDVKNGSRLTLFLKSTLKRLAVIPLQAHYTALCSSAVLSPYVHQPCTIVGSFMDPEFDIKRKVKGSSLPQTDKDTLIKIKELASTHRLLIQIGSFYPHKNQLTTIRSLPILKQQDGLNNFHLILIGSESYAPYLAKLKLTTSQNNLSDYVSLLPTITHREGMKLLYKILNLNRAIVISPTLDEGVPRILMESGGYKIPGIWSNLDGAHDLICDGKNGLLLDDPLDHQKLAKVIGNLATDPDLYRDLSLGAYQNVKRFSLSDYSGKYLEVYQRVLNQNKLPPLESSLPKQIILLDLNYAPTS